MGHLLSRRGVCEQRIASTARNAEPNYSRAINVFWAKGWRRRWPGIIEKQRDWRVTSITMGRASFADVRPWSDCVKLVELIRVNRIVNRFRSPWSDVFCVALVDDNLRSCESLSRAWNCVWQITPRCVTERPTRPFGKSNKLSSSCRNGAAVTLV
jgi:hypothetical protein